MSDAALDNPGLRKKLRPSRGEAAGRNASDQLGWGTVLPRVSEKTISLVASLGGYGEDESDLDAVLTGWDSSTLSLLLEGTSGARGLVQLDAEMIAGLTEVQTVGKVLSSVVSPRPVNPVDATLCDHVVTAWLTGVAHASDGRAFAGWTVGHLVADQRAAKVLLDDGDYSATEIKVTMGGGARTGVMRILRPLSRPKAATIGSPQATSGREAILNVPAELEAILFRTQVPLSWLRGLKVGEVLEIPRNAIEFVRLETADGRRVGRAHLGRSGEFRAVRIMAENDPSLIGASQKAEFEGGGAGDIGVGRAPSAGIGTLPDLSKDAVVDMPQIAVPDLEPAGLPDLAGGDLPDLGGGDSPGLPPLEGLPDLSGGGDLSDLPGLPKIE